MIRNSLAALVLAATALAAAAQGAAPPLDPARARAADRLMEVQSPRQLMQDMAVKMSAQMEPAQREPFMAMMRDAQLLDRIILLTREALARHFTAEELNALADFYSQPIARSAMGKMDSYMADIAPRMIHEILQKARELEAAGKAGAAKK
jgi:uncharacterized protein